MEITQPGGSGGGSGSITVKDSTTTVSNVTTIDFSGATVSDGGGGIADVTINATPGGSDTQVQFNDGGAFGGDTGFTYNKTNDSVTLTKLSIGTSAASNLLLTNTTAAAAGAQQYSPIFEIEGQGWKTNATAASQSVKYGQYVVPDQAAANPTARYIVSRSINGAAYSPYFALGVPSGDAAFSGGFGGLTLSSHVIGAFTSSNPANDILANFGGIINAAQLNETGALEIRRVRNNSLSSKVITLSNRGTWAEGETNTTDSAFAIKPGQTNGLSRLNGFYFDEDTLGAGDSLIGKSVASGGNLYIYYDNTEKFRIDSNGIALANSGISAPTSVVHVQGSLGLPYVVKTSNYTATVSDYTIDCGSATFTVGLPTASGITGRVYVIKNSGTNTITIDGTGEETIDGSTTQVLVSQYSSLMVQSTGSNWIVIGRN